MREGAQLYAEADAAEPIGQVSSGGFGPSVGGPVAMGYLPAAIAARGGVVFAEVRGQRLPIKIGSPTFVSPSYQR